VTAPAKEPRCQHDRHHRRTGALNGATVEHLLNRLPADQIGVSVRDVAKAQHFADRGVRVRRGLEELITGRHWWREPGRDSIRP